VAYSPHSTCRSAESSKIVNARCGYNASIDPVVLDGMTNDLARICIDYRYSQQSLRLKSIISTTHVVDNMSLTIITLQATCPDKSAVKFHSSVITIKY